MKKLALLLALCLAVTMLPGIGYTEVGVEDNGTGIRFDDRLSREDSELELADPGEIDGVLIDGDMDIELEALSRSMEIPDDFGDIPLQEGEQIPPEAENDGEAGQSGSPEGGAAEEAKPHVDPDGPQLETNEMTLGIGDYRYLNAKMPDTQSDEGITYFSTNSSIAKVYKSGRITGVSEGFAVISAAGENGAYSECFVTVKKAPVKVSFGVSSLVLGKGEKYKQLKVSLGDPAEEYAGSYTIESENPKVVKLSGNNVLKGVKKGSTRIKVLTYNGIKATLKVTVKPAPGRIDLSVDKAALGVGESGKVSYKLPKGTASAVTFTSDNPKVVSVDKNTGAITGVAIGKTKIRGKTFNGHSDSVTVEVLPAPQKLSFESEAVRLGVGMKLKTVATVDEGAAASIAYSVGDTSVATYTDGTLKGVKEGRTVLTATTANGLSASCTVEVVAAPTKVKLPWSTLSIGVKQSVKLEPNVGSSASTFTYSSSNKRYVKVSKDGTVTGVKKGSATITVKTYNGKKCKLKVKVVKAPGSVELSPDSLELNIGETAALSWSFPKGTASAVSFESSDPAVATVDPQTGVVTGVSGGQATITVTTSNGKTDQTQVTVLSMPQWIRFTEEYVEIGVSQAHQLTVEMESGASADVLFTSSNSFAATVSEDGVVTGVGEGQATITASIGDGSVKATVDVTVLSAPGEVKFDPSEMALNVGDTVLLMPVIPEGSATGFTYTSSAPEVASVSEDGTLSALAVGEAVVTVTTSNGLNANLRVKVVDPAYPESVQLTNVPSSMKVGETLQLEWKVTPSGANADLMWQTSNADIAYVDETGVLHAVSMGFATITATSRRNPAIVLSFRVSVESEDVTLTIPARITGTKDIKSNLARIDAIRQSAISQIDRLKADGQITSSDASKRKHIINKAFADYAFPWMTPKKQVYWNYGYAEGGAKDFKPDRVYYGVPYTQKGRGYNVERLLNNKLYTDSGKGYYLLDQSKIKDVKNNHHLEGRYKGSDCSSFVSAAIWGLNSSHSDDRTSDIIKNSVYKTIKSPDSLRTGDLICKGHAHVVMFLYFVNAEKTKMMIIENGGIEDGTNTVHCMIMNTNWYTSRGYKGRRLKSLG